MDITGDGEPASHIIEHVDESVEKQNRNPRWSQAETLVLVAAKKRQAEELSLVVTRPRNPTADERWESIAAYCKANSSDRNAHQCRKRWFALYGDYKKIKDWQRLSTDSYWGMKNDKRRDNKLPGTFDRVVFVSMDSWLKKGPEPNFDISGRPEEGLSSEIEQDIEGHELMEVGRRDGTSLPRSEQTGDLGDKRYRNPRWSLHESLILLAAKKKQEDDIVTALKAKTRTISADERWESIAAHCRANGCERNAYQCRKRWSALLGDFKRIRDWQRSSVDSYWLMKNEKRKENKLPAIFDHEVFASMDTWVGKRGGRKLTTDTEDLFETARPNGGLFSDVEQDRDGQLDPEMPTVGCQRDTIMAPESGTNNREEMPSDSTACNKRKRAVTGDTNEFRGKNLAAVFQSSVKSMQIALAENTQMQIQAHHSNVQSQIEAHNHNSKLDRIQRKEQGDNLVGVLGKLADALAKIADKLV